MLESDYHRRTFHLEHIRAIPADSANRITRQDSPKGDDNNGASFMSLTDGSGPSMAGSGCVCCGAVRLPIVT